MERKIYGKLLEWKNEKDKKPLMILGVRQCGKTYIIDEFCKKEYKNYVYFNLLDDRTLVDVFASNLNSSEKYSRLKNYSGIELEDDNAVLFIDEIQESEYLISFMKYLNEEHPKVNVITAGSLLGVKLKRMKMPFPVGKVEIEHMYPLDFEEFLMAINKNMYIDEIKNAYNNNIPLADSIHETCLEYYYYYLYIGGMPSNVKEYVDKDFDVLRMKNNILSNLKEEYIADMNKYLDKKSDALRINETYKSLPFQLGNESHKFMYSKINKGARRKDYESAIDWLINSSLVLKTKVVTSPKTPLEGFSDSEYFKLYLSDVGILANMLGININEILNDSLSLYKGVLAENYVASQLAFNNYNLYYWKNDNKAEVDFLINTKEGIIPVEVKASDNVQAKSLTQYIKTYNPQYGIRLSQKNFGYDERVKIKSIPLYAAFMIK